MGNKSTREIREKIEQFNEDNEKKDIEWTIPNQELVYEQMQLLSRYFNLQKIQLDFSGKDIVDITPLKDALQGGEIFEQLKISASNTKINDGNILPQHINTLVRFHLDLLNTEVYDFSEVFQALNNNEQLESIYLNLNGTKLTSIKLLDVHLFKKLKAITLFARDTQVEHIDQFCLNVSKLKHLEELHLDFSRAQVTDIASLESALRQLGGLIQLTIKLDSIPIDNIFGLISGISHCVNLMQLTLSLNNTKIVDVDQCGELLKQMQKLEYLNFQFSSTPVSSADNLLQKIGYLTALKSLSLNFRDTKIVSTSLNRILDALQKLQHFKISVNEEFDETILEGILQQEQLKSLVLDLNDSKVQSLDKLMNSLGDLKLLRHLQILISHTQVEELNLSNLSKLKNLRTLQIDISQQFIKPRHTAIKKLIGLEEEIGKIKFLNYLELDVSGTKFEKSGLNERLEVEIKQLQYLKEFHLL